MIENSDPAAGTNEKETVSLVHKFSVGEHEVFAHVYIDRATGQPIGLCVNLPRESSALAGLMNAFASAITVCLEHGVPLKTLCEEFVGKRFEPSGRTDNEDLPHAKSVVDYLFRWLRMTFLSPPPAA